MTTIPKVILRIHADLAEPLFFDVYLRVGRYLAVLAAVLNKFRQRGLPALQEVVVVLLLCLVLGELLKQETVTQFRLMQYNLRHRVDLRRILAFCSPDLRTFSHQFLEFLSLDLVLLFLVSLAALRREVPESKLGFAYRGLMTLKNLIS